MSSAPLEQTGAVTQTKGGSKPGTRAPPPDVVFSSPAPVHGGEHLRGKNFPAHIEAGEPVSSRALNPARPIFRKSPGGRGADGGMPSTGKSRNVSWSSKGGVEPSRTDPPPRSPVPDASLRKGGSIFSSSAKRCGAAFLGIFPFCFFFLFFFFFFFFPFFFQNVFPPLSFFPLFKVPSFCPPPVHSPFFSQAQRKNPPPAPPKRFHPLSLGSRKLVVRKKRKKKKKKKRKKKQKNQTGLST